MNQAEDVEVVLAHDRRYKFHSGTLARNSTLLADLLIEPYAAKLSNRAKNAGIKIRWMIELKELPSDKHPAGILDLVELTPAGERADGRTGLIVNENGRIPTKIFDHYEAILYAFYNKEMRICDSDMRAALDDVIQIIAIADYLGCTNIISKPVEVALMKHGQSLFRAVQSMPHLWAKMAYDIKSELIFREAMVHLAGNWKRMQAKPAAMLTLKEYPGIGLLAEKCHARLVDKGKTLEQMVMSAYPGRMDKPTDYPPIKREEYAKDILVWMALAFFRHWLGQRIILEKGHQADDSGYELYRSLGSAGEAYMNKPIMNQFHHRFPMTKKAMNVLENHLLEIKENIKQRVDQHGILESYCQLDVHRYPVDYLTCVKVEREDFPWLTQDLPSATPGAGLKRGRRPGGNDIARHNLVAAKRSQEREASFDLDDEVLEEAHPSDAANKRVRHN